MKETITLEVNKRTLTGKRVKQLRNEGVVPGVVYGPTQSDTLAVQIPWATLRPTLLKAGGTSLVELQVDGESVSVLVRDVQRHPTRGDVMHIDFYAVDVTQTIRTYIPVQLSDRDAAGKRLGVTIFQPLNTIEVESLPGDIPNYVEVDLDLLQEPGDQITVSDITPIPGVTFLADPDRVVAQAAAYAVAEQAEEEEEILEDMDMEDIEIVGRKAREDDEDEDEDN